MFGRRKLSLSAILFSLLLSGGCFTSKTVVTKVAPPNKKSRAAGKAVSATVETKAEQDGDGQGDLQQTEPKGKEEKGGAVKAAYLGSTPKKDGVMYALPQTVLKVDVPLTRKDSTPGEFHRYAQCFLPEEADSRITLASTSFSIGKPTFDSRGVQDPSNVYLVNTKGGIFTTKSLLLTYKDGMILGKAEAEATNESIDVAIAAATTLVKLAAPFLPFGTPGPRFLGVLPNPKEGNKVEFDADALDNKRKECRPIFQAASAAEAAAKSTLAAHQAMTAADLAVKAAAAAQEPAARALANEAKQSADLAKRKAAVATDPTLDDKPYDPKDPQNPNPDPNKIVFPSAELAEAAVKETDFAINKALLVARMVKDKEEEKAAATAEAAKAARLTVQAVTRAKDEITDEKIFNAGYEEANLKNTEIFSLQEKRQQLITGENRPDNLSKEALKLMLEELDNTITVMKQQYFLGRSVPTLWTPGFEYTPRKNDGAEPGPEVQPLFIFSKEGGVCEAPTIGTHQVIVPPEFHLEEYCHDQNAMKNVDVSITRLGDVADTVTESFPLLKHAKKGSVEDPSEKGDRGFYYRIPGKALVILKAGSSEKGRASLQIAQYGPVVSLPASAGGRNHLYAITLDPATGALTEFKLVTKPLLDKSIVSQSEVAAKAVLDAKKAADEANDPTARLKKNTDYVNAQTDFIKAQKNLEKERAVTNSNP